MEIKASRTLKLVYCLTLVGIVPVGLTASSGWIGLLFGVSLFRPGFLFPVVLLLLITYRIISVFRNPIALDVHVTGVFSRVIRAIAVVLMWAGLLSITGLFFVKPITLAIFHNAGDADIGYFVVGVFLIMLAALGIIGIVVFEIIRVRGVRFREGPSCSASPAKGEKPVKSRLKFSQSFSALAVLIAMGFTLHAIAGNILWDAISRNDMGKAKILITIGADVNQKNSIGNPILHHAVSSGNPELVEVLISKGADVNAKGQFDRVALHYANKKGMAKILLAHGATVDAPTNYGETPLHWAAEGVNGLDKQVDLIEFVDVLISHGADVNRKTGEGRSYATPLNYAVASNNIPVAKLLIAHGADVEGGGSSPLSGAATVAMAQLLVDSGAGVNTRSTAGWYPLHSAANRGNTQVTNYLLARGANPNAVSGIGLTALYLAAGSDYGADAAEALLNYGADPNARNASGQTALHQAASQGATRVIEILLAHKADINAADNSGYVPLLGAISYGMKNGRKPVEVLVNNGANVNAESARGETPLGNAIERGDIEILKLLIAHGANVKANKYGVSPLYLARDSKEITELLKEHGAH